MPDLLGLGMLKPWWFRSLVSQKLWVNVLKGIQRSRMGGGSLKFACEATSHQTASNPQTTVTPNHHFNFAHGPWPTPNAMPPTASSPKRSKRRPWDELRPYKVGGALRNPPDAPLSPLGLAPPYDLGIGPVHSAAWLRGMRLLRWLIDWMVG